MNDNVMVLKTDCGITLDSMFQCVRKAIFEGQIGELLYGQAATPKTWEEVETLIETEVEEREITGGQRWDDLFYVFSDTQAICDFLLDRVKQEHALMLLPRPQSAIAKVCFALSQTDPDDNAQIRLLASNIGYPQAEIRRLTETHPALIASLEEAYVNRMRAARMDFFDNLDTICGELGTD